MGRREKIVSLGVVVDDKFRSAINWYSEETGEIKEIIVPVLERCLKDGFIGTFVGEYTYKHIHKIAENIESKLKWVCNKYIRAGAYLKLIKIKVKINEKDKNILVNNLISD